MEENVSLLPDSAHNLWYLKSKAYEGYFPHNTDVEVPSKKLLLLPFLQIISQISAVTVCGSRCSSPYQSPALVYCENFCILNPVIWIICAASCSCFSLSLLYFFHFAIMLFCFFVITDSNREDTSCIFIFFCCFSSEPQSIVIFFNLCNCIFRWMIYF